MSVIVKNMEMPKGSCEWIGENGSLRRCKLLNGDDDCKMQEGVCADATWEEQFAGCPLVEIPAPHGRLIDADKFEFEMNDKLLIALTEKYGEKEAQSGLHFSFRDCICNIQCQPTVIEAEGRQHHD